MPMTETLTKKRKRLTTEEKAEAVEAYTVKKEKQSAIAARLGVSQATISLLITKNQKVAKTESSENSDG